MDTAYDLAAAFQRFMDSGPWIVPAFLYMLVISIPVTLIHELGHALAVSRRLAGDVEVVVGDAGKLAELRLGQISASVNAFSRPDRIAGYAGFDDRDATAQDIFWVAVCGPAASVGAGVVAAFALSAAPATGVLHDVLWATTLVGLGTALSLVPMEIQERRDGPRTRTDGRLALDALRAARALR